MRNVFTLLFALCILLSMSGMARSAVTPVLYFSDITSGPATGLGDGLGSGAIVTIWGKNLGSSQGSSTVTACGSAPSHVYTWANASIQNGHPADLYTWHKMQYIQFSLGSNATSGSGTISVTVGGVTSNTLPFTVRSGKIYFVMPAGNDSNSGSWSAPFATPDQASQVMSAGDIMYLGAITYTNPNGFIIGGNGGPYKNGTLATPFSMLAYPGATPQFLNPTSDGYAAIDNGARNNSFWTFSRLYITSDQAGVDPFNGLRAVALAITDTCCANSEVGAFTTGQAPQNSAGAWFFGNYIFNYGSPTAKNGCGPSSNLTHTTYFSNRHSYGSDACSSSGWQNNSNCVDGPVELGWNNLQNNGARGGINWYDEGYCGGFSGTSLVHDNVVMNQVGPAIDFGASCDPAWPHDNINANVYNNLLVNDGLIDSQSATYPVVQIKAGNPNTNPGPNGTFNFYNNTLVQDQSSSGSEFLDGNGLSTAIAAGRSTATYSWQNNIAYETSTEPWDATNDSNSIWSTPASTGGVSNHNLWYYSGGTTTAPAWDTSPLTSNPLFNNVSGNDFSLQQSGSPSSPALNAGYNTSIVLRDILGDVRPSPPSIGAFDDPPAGSSGLPAITTAPWIVQ